MATFEHDARLDDLDLDELEGLAATMTGGDPVSALEALGQRVAAATASGETTVELPAPNGVTVTYSTDLTPHQFQSIQTKCKDKRGDIDIDRSSALLLARQCRAIAVDGAAVSDGGKALTFGSKTVQSIIGATDAVDAVRRLYGGPAKRYGFRVQATANRILDDAGLGESATPVDDDSDPDPS